MSNLLIRGLSPKIHQKIQKLADLKKRSVNQVLVELIVEAVERRDDEASEEEKRHEAFRRLREFREEMRKKYGRTEDSTKIIREERDKLSERFFQ